MERPLKLLNFVNKDRDLFLAVGVVTAGTSRARRKGLLGLTSWTEFQGLWILPCEAIHTFGMQMSIDSVFLDRDLRVRALKPAMKPCRIAVCLRAYSVLELPVGSIAASRTVLGDQVAVLPA
jgi:uncharacterized protein